MDNYSVGKLVEVASKEEGFVDSYYEAKVVKSIPHQRKYLVQYTTRFEKENGLVPLTKMVDETEIRPIPPQSLHNPFKFKKFDDVNAYNKHGWWVGVITGRDEDGGGDKDHYDVYFPIYKVVLKYHASKLRTHCKYEKGGWLFYNGSGSPCHICI